MAPTIDWTEFMLNSELYEMIAANEPVFITRNGVVESVLCHERLVSDRRRASDCESNVDVSVNDQLAR